MAIPTSVPPLSPAREGKMLSPARLVEPGKLWNGILSPGHLGGPWGVRPHPEGAGEE